MGLIKKLKEIITRKNPRIETTNLIGYDTSLVYIPQYGELKEEEKKLVDSYVSEIDITKLENLILYGNKIHKAANGNTEMLLNVLYKITEEQSEKKLSTMTEEEILEERLNKMIMQEKLELYKVALESLEKETTLRTVALKETLKRRKRDFKQWGIFEKAERLERKNQKEQLELSIERLKINKKIIEQQTQSITNAKLASRNVNTIYRYV